jgi:hypothetical protein
MNLDGGEEGSFCLDTTTLVTCTRGMPTTTSCAEGDGKCTDDLGTARCASDVAPDPADGGEGDGPPDPVDDDGGDGDDDDDGPGDDGDARAGARQFSPSVRSGCAQDVPPGELFAVTVATLLGARRRRRVGPRATPTTSTASAALRD